MLVSYIKVFVSELSSPTEILKKLINMMLDSDDNNKPIALLSRVKYLIFVFLIIIVFISVA